MQLYLRTDLSPRSCSSYRRILAVCWFLGLSCGVVSYCTGTVSDLCWRIDSASGSPEFAALCVNGLPVLLSVFSVLFSVQIMLYPICFIKAFLAGFLFTGVLHQLGSCGWLLSWVFLFIDWSMMPVLYLYWLHSLSGGTTLFSRCWDAALLTAAFCGLAYIDHSIISPLSAYLIDF